MAGRLDQMIFDGPFQIKPFYDSMILHMQAQTVAIENRWKTDVSKRELL